MRKMKFLKNVPKTFQRCRVTDYKKFLESNFEDDKKKLISLFLGMNSLKRNKYEDAKQFLKTSNELSKKSGDRENEIQSLKHLAQAYFENEEYKNSFSLFQKLYEMTKDDKHSLMKDYALIKLGESSKALKEFKKSENYFQKALNSSQAHIQATAYQNLAILLMEENKLEESLEMIEKTFQISQDDPIEAKSLIIKGIILKKKGKEEPGQFYLNTGIEYIISSNDKSFMKSAQKLFKENEIEVNFVESKETQERLEELHKPTYRDLLEEIRVSLTQDGFVSTEKVKELLNFKGIFQKKALDLFQKGEYAYAIDFYEQLYEIVELQRCYDQDAIEIVQNLADSYAKLKKYHKAIKYYEKFYKWLKKYGDDRDDQYYALYEIGKCFFYMKDFKNANHFLQQVLSFSPKEFHHLVAREILSLLEYEKKNLDLAIDHLKEALISAEQINDPERVAKLEKRYKYLLKEKKLEEVTININFNINASMVLFQEVLDIIEKEFDNDPYILVDALTSYALNLLNEKVLDLAGDIIRKALFIQDEYGLRDDVKKFTSDIAAKIFYEMEDFEKAVYFFAFSYKLDRNQTILKQLQIGKVALLALNKEKFENNFQDLLLHSPPEKIRQIMWRYSTIFYTLINKVEKARKYYNLINFDKEFEKEYYKIIMDEIEKKNDKILDIFKQIEFKSILAKQITKEDYQILYDLVKNPTLKNLLIENQLVSNENKKE